MRRNMSILVLFAIGLGLGWFLKNVKIGLILGLMIGILIGMVGTRGK
jgi:hypothetical protein